MSLPRVRFTLRSMMVAVALVAVGLGVCRKWQIRVDRLDDARLCATRARVNRAWMGSDGPHPTKWSPDGNWHEARRRAYYWDKMRRKYERAAAYPWFSIEPDPPPPN